MRGDYRRAVREFDKAIHYNPNYTEAYYNRGNAYHHEGKYDCAILDYDRATELNPKYAEAHCNRGL